MSPWQASPRRPSGRRAMLYSHDTFGLGHIRRARVIAQALTSAHADLSALIVTGSPVAGRFDFADRVDHVRLPGVVKLADGSYASHNLGIDVEDTTRLRGALLDAAAEAFDPDIIIVDKEPWGFRGELAGVLEGARRRGARMVLGVRDVLDAPRPLAEEWARKNAVEAVERFYDEIWIYGSPEVCRPLEGLGLSDRSMARALYTGYLRREEPEGGDYLPDPPFRDFILVTTGGGGDGAALVDWTLSAYESDPGIPWPAVIVYGPFLNSEQRSEFERRAAALGEDRIATLGFDSRIERLLREARGVVAMGGYNTFCEVLSLDKPAVIAPRSRPRLEQYIRAAAAERLGLLRMLHPERDGAGPEVMAAAIRGLADQPPPSAGRIAGLLDGLDVIASRVGAAAGPLPAAQAGP